MRIDSSTVSGTTAQFGHVIINGSSITSTSGVLTIGQFTFSGNSIINQQQSGSVNFAIPYSSYVRYDTQGSSTAGWGSVSTKVARFTNVTTKGTNLSASQSSTSGDLIIVNANGGYLIEGCIVQDNPATLITKNAIDFTTDPRGNAISGTVIRSMGSTSAASDNAIPMSKVVDLVAGDQLRIHGRGTAQSFFSESYFNVTRLY